MTMHAMDRRSKRRVELAVTLLDIAPAIFPPFVAAWREARLLAERERERERGIPREKLVAAACPACLDRESPFSSRAKFSVSNIWGIVPALNRNRRDRSYISYRKCHVQK